jgi:beta-glucosidase
MNRRELLGSAVGIALAAGARSVNAAAVQPASRERSPYPKGFLWGVAGAGYQIEGNNVNADIWLLEHVQPTLFAEPSGDACDHYHRYRDDVALVKDLGFNTLRMSVEWARIEPAPGQYSTAELEHYRRVLSTCREQGLKPFVTFNHFAAPRWFSVDGGWENPRSPDMFARYCERTARHLGDQIEVAATFNEPNLGFLLRWLLPPPMLAVQKQMLDAAARATGSQHFSSVQMGDQEKLLPQLLSAHRKGSAAIKAAAPHVPCGLTLALVDDQAVGPDSQRDRKRKEVNGPWLEAARSDDFVGVQTYSRNRIDRNGMMPVPDGAEKTQTGDEFYPEALEATIRYAAKETGRPVYVTENGIATTDDTRRIAYIDRALAGVQRCLVDGVDVRSYIHWTLLDNFEWIFGYGPKFGLVAVDRETQLRTPKPSARHLGEIARAASS